MLLLLPFERKVDWTKPPVITLALILINCIVFFGIQSGDNERYRAAEQYYFGSILPSIEFTAYAKYLKDGEDELANEVRKANPKKDRWVLAKLQSDRKFLKKLNNSEIITPADFNHKAWKQARQAFDALYADIVTPAYSFSRDKPVTYLTSMFLHSGFMHLFGNMVFLFIVGFTVERVIGGSRFLISYLLVGLLAMGLWALVYPDLGALGASGAISGVMSMYAILYGLRKIRFFYFIIFYFNYIKAPAWILPPLWIANELYGIYFGYGGIGYVAHIGGLLGGIALGLVHKKVLQSSDEAYLDEPQKNEQRLDNLEIALEHMRRLEYDKARPLFERLLEEYPDHIEALMPLYHIYKREPDSERYHAVARRILTLASRGDVNMAQGHSIFSDYAEHARPGPQLAEDELLGFAKRFAKGGFESDAERIIAYLLRKSPRLPGLPEGLYLLAEAFRRSGDRDKFKRYANLVIRGYPHSSVAPIATKALGVENA